MNRLNRKQNNVINKTDQFHLIRIGKDDVDSYVIKDLKNLIFESENLYPGIDKWYKRQVEPGYSGRSRVSYIVYDNNIPIASMVIRLSNRAKLCSLRVIPKVRGKGVGSALFQIASYEIGQKYSQFHFTAPESLVVTAGDYFKRLGFKAAGVVNKHYRPGEGEFGFTGMVNDIKKRIESNLEYTLFGPKISLEPNKPKWLVLSVKPEFASKIISGFKRIELRRQFSKTHRGSMVLIYSTSPQQSILGFAKISDVQQIDTFKIKNEFMNMVGCDPQQIDDYSHGVDSLWALTLSDIESFYIPIPRKDLESSFQIQLKPPVSYQVVDQNSSWWRIIESITTEHNTFVNQDEKKESIINYTCLTQTTLW